MIGERFGKWTVLEDAGKNIRGRRHYICQCECGRKKYVVASELKCGRSSQCKFCAKKIMSTFFFKKK